MAADLPGTEAVAGEDRYREIFDSAPVSLWDEDFSAVAAFFDRLRAQGVIDLRAHLLSHPEHVEEAIRRVRVIDVNASPSTSSRSSGSRTSCSRCRGSSCPTPPRSSSMRW
jgi:hypothetical protein